MKEVVGIAALMPSIQASVDPASRLHQSLHAPNPLPAIPTTPLSPNRPSCRNTHILNRRNGPMPHMRGICRIKLNEIVYPGVGYHPLFFNYRVRNQRTYIGKPAPKRLSGFFSFLEP